MWLKGRRNWKIEIEILVFYGRRIFLGACFKKKKTYLESRSKRRFAYCEWPVRTKLRHVELHQRRLNRRRSFPIESSPSNCGQVLRLFYFEDCLEKFRKTNACLLTRLNTCIEIVERMKKKKRRRKKYIFKNYIFMVCVTLPKYLAVFLVSIDFWKSMNHNAYMYFSCFLFKWDSHKYKYICIFLETWNV